MVSVAQETPTISKRQQKRQLRESGRASNQKQPRFSNTPGTSTSVTPNDGVVLEKTSSRKGINWTLQLLGVLVVILATVFLKSGQESWHDRISNARDFVRDPYKELNVTRKATRADIRNAYRELSLIWHPDRRESCDSECRERFQRINEAFKLLNNNERRKLYDETEKDAKANARTFASEIEPFEYQFSPHVWNDIVVPSISGYQLSLDNSISGVWAVFVGDPRSEITEKFLPMWSDLALRFYGRASFLRVDATNPLAAKYLPLRVKITPAIMLIVPGQMPALYSDIFNFTPAGFSRWLVDNLPNHYIEVPTSDTSSLVQTIKNNTRDEFGRLPVVLYTAQKLNSVFLSLAIKYGPLFNFYHARDPKILSALGVDHKVISAVASSGLLLAQSAGSMRINHPLPRGLFTVDNMKQVSRDTTELKSSQAWKALNLTETAMNAVIAASRPAIYEETYTFLCGGQQKYCEVYDRPNKNGLPVEKMNGESITQEVWYPNTRRGSESAAIKSYLKESTSGRVVISLENNSLCLDPTNPVWIPLKSERNLFPELRLGRIENLNKWIRENPITIACTTGFVVVICAAVQIFRYFTADEDEESE